MNLPLDSINLLKHKIDSLESVIHNKNLHLDLASLEPPVQAAIIVSVTTLITVCLGFAIKDYIIPGCIEKRTQRRTGQNLFRLYKSNLFKSSLYLAFRISEIYNTRAHFLMESPIRGEFYDYKYLSTIYRLCTLLGWIRAYQLEESFIVTNKKDELHKLSEALKILASKLADGQTVETYVTQAILALGGIKSSNIVADILTKLNTDIDHLIHEYITKYNVELISELTEEQQLEYIKELEAKIKSHKINLVIPLTSNAKDTVNKSSVKIGLLYRDWQNAIGDMMLEKSTNKTVGVYSVISYKNFEELWKSSETNESKKWILRAEKIFKDLSISDATIHDSRVEQIKQIYSVLYNLIKVLFEINIGNKPISKDEFNKIKKKL